MALRKPTSDENRLLLFLVNSSNEAIGNTDDILDNIIVANMRDGGMGSIRIFPQGSNCNVRKCGKCVSSCMFTDIDGVNVIASLFVDSEGLLYELDIWKTDYSKLVRIPTDVNSFELFNEQ